MPSSIRAHIASGRDSLCFTILFSSRWNQWLWLLYTKIGNWRLAFAQQKRRPCERRSLLGRVHLLVDGNLDDLFLNRVCDQLLFVVDIELPHEVEFMGFHGFHAQAEDHRNLLH